MNPTFRQLLCVIALAYSEYGQASLSFHHVEIATHVHRVQDWWCQTSLKDFTLKATCNEYESNMQRIFLKHDCCDYRSRRGAPKTRAPPLTACPPFIRAVPQKTSGQLRLAERGNAATTSPIIHALEEDALE